eukprot:COSAG04_NODE_2910_length_3395_cov_1.852852_2_plen_54_part_00
MQRLVAVLAAFAPLCGKQLCLFYTGQQLPMQHEQEGMNKNENESEGTLRVLLH